MKGTHIAAIATLLLAGCGAREDTPPRTEAAHIYGWTDADNAYGPGVTFVESPTAPGFQLRCITAAKVLRVTVDNPIEAPPAASEPTALQLGVQQFTGTATGDAMTLSSEFALTAPLLIALGDAKTARLAFRDTAVDAGVDSDGRIAAFATRCTQTTGVEPSLE